MSQAGNHRNAEDNRVSLSPMRLPPFLRGLYTTPARRPRSPQTRVQGMW